MTVVTRGEVRGEAPALIALDWGTTIQAFAAASAAPAAKSGNTASQGLWRIAAAAGLIWNDRRTPAGQYSQSEPKP